MSFGTFMTVYMRGYTPLLPPGLLLMDPWAVVKIALS